MRLNEIIEISVGTSMRFVEQPYSHKSLSSNPNFKQFHHVIMARNQFIISDVLHRADVAEKFGISPTKIDEHMHDLRQKIEYASEDNYGVLSDDGIHLVFQQRGKNVNIPIDEIIDLLTVWQYY